MSQMRKKRKRRDRAAAQAEAKRRKQEELEDLEGAEAEAASEAETDAEAESEAEAETETETETGTETAGDPEVEVTELSEEDLEEYRARLKGRIESLLFASDRPLDVHRLRKLLREANAPMVKEALAELEEDYFSRGVVLEAVAGGYQFRTNPEYSEDVQRLVEGRPVRLSRAQLETLSIIAYRQPITRPEIDDIRGVDSGSTLKVLLDRGLIRILGKKEEPGRPLLYGTTKDFLEFFQLNDLSDLPTLREYHELTEDSLREVERLEAELPAGEGETEAASETETEAASETETETASETETETETEAASETEDEDEDEDEDEPAAGDAAAS